MSEDTKQPVLIDRDELIERLLIEFDFRYAQCPESESQGGIADRMAKGAGFLNAIKIVSEFKEATK